MIKKLEHGSTRHFWNPLKKKSARRLIYTRDFYCLRLVFVDYNENKRTENVTAFTIINLSFRSLEAGLRHRSRGKE